MTNETTAPDYEFVGLEGDGSRWPETKPQVRECGRSMRERRPATSGEDGALALLVEISQRVQRIEELLGSPSEPRERWWTPDEIARKVDRAALTVREWARLRKIPSKKDSRGRRWISDPVAQAIFRYQGLPPEEEFSALSKP